MTFGASRAGRGDFGSPLKNREVHVHSIKAADGLLVAGSSVGDSVGRSETASIETTQPLVTTWLERLGLCLLALLLCAAAGSYGLKS